MKRNHLAIILLSVLVLSACSHKTAACTSNSKLDDLKSLNVLQAVTDADHAYANGDRRLLGVYGYALEVPELSGNPDNYRYGIRPLDGTSDTACDDRERSLNTNARAYAKEYNEEILSQVKKAGG
jgi:hypothetical protein